MEFLKAFLTEGIQFVLMCGVAVLAVLGGIALSKSKDARKDEE